MNLKTSIEEYIPYNEQEVKDKQLILQYINTFQDVLTRKNEIGHMTASAWILNKEKTKVLMIYHNIYRSWAWVGGHADGEENLLEVALRETKEETGVTKVVPIDENIFSLQIVAVDGHKKRGKYVATHVHLDSCFLLEVDEKETLKIKKDENSGVKWIPLEEVIKESTEERMYPIYQKLIEKTYQIRGERK